MSPGGSGSAPGIAAGAADSAGAAGAGSASGAGGAAGAGGASGAADAAPALPAGTAPAPSLLLPFVAGLHFGVLQVCLFLAIQVGFTATALGYFAVVLAWMAGVVSNLRWGRPAGLMSCAAVSLLAYAGLLVLLWLLPPQPLLVPLLGLLVALAALPAGALFRGLATQVASGPLFLHENNGFVLGSVLAVVAFVQWGVHALVGAPLVTAGLLLLATRRDGRPALAALLAAAVAAQALESTTAFVLLLVGAVLATITHGLAVPPPAELRAPRAGAVPAVHPWSTLSLRARRLMLLLAGFCLMLLQALLTREFSNVLSACELSILVVGTAYFAGLSVGYGWLRRLPLPVLRAALLPAFLLHAALLVASRPVAGWLIREGHGVPVLVGLLFVCAFTTSALYSMLLPRLIELAGPGSLVASYAWDLVGAALGVSALLAMSAWAPALVWPSYLLAMAALLTLMLTGSRWQLSFALVALALTATLAVHQRALGTAALEDYYRSQGYGYPGIVFSGNSFYHSIDIVDSHRDEQRTQKKRRQSFINGVQYFSCRFDEQGRIPPDGDLSEFTDLLAELPARYLSTALGRPLRILVMGCGSMHSMQAVQPFSARTTMVEIDPLVFESARVGWGEANRWQELDPARNEFVADDARHYLASSDERFDLIVMDISAPYYLGTAVLHCREFFELVRSRLAPGGLFAESTQSPPDRQQPDAMSMRILRAASDAFPAWRVVATKPGEAVQHGFVYGAIDGRFDDEALRAALASDGWASRVHLRAPGDGSYELDGVRPFTLTNMDSLLASNHGRIAAQLEGLPPGRGSPDTAEGPAFLYSRAALAEVFDARYVIGGLVVVLAALVLPLLRRRRAAR